MPRGWKNFRQEEDAMIAEVNRRCHPTPKKRPGPSGHIRVWLSPKIPDNPFPEQDRIWVNPRLSLK